MAGSFKNVLVLAINGKALARADFEDRMAQEMGRPGVTVTQSYVLMPRPDATPINMSDLRGYVQDNKFDAVVASRIVKLDQTWKEVDPGDFPFYPYYGTLYGYYAAVAPVVYDPSYMEKETDVQVETNWYATVAPDGQLVWTGTTDWKNPRSEPRFICFEPSFMAQRNSRIHARCPSCGNVAGQECRKTDDENGGQKDRATLIEWQEIIIDHSQL